MPGLSEKHFSNSVEKVAPLAPDYKTELRPANVELVHRHSIAYVWQQADHLIRVECPICHERVMVMHEKMKWHWCLGFSCSSGTMTFAEVVEALGKAERP